MSGSNPVLQAAAAPFGEAQSLPFEIYHNPDWLAAEQAHVFTGEWVMACTAEQVANPGDCFALQVANEPVLQWCKMVSPSLTSAAPFIAIRLLISTSSSASR